MRWSYSDWTLYDSCARRYHEIKVLKKYKPQETEELRYGNALHKCAELYVKEGTDLPPQFQFIKPYLDPLLGITGNRECELKLGLTAALEPCDFFSPDVWWRGVADLFIEDGEIGHLIDYKTGKNAKYASTDQLELLALALFRHYPKLQRIKSGLLFVVVREFIRKSFSRNDVGAQWAKWLAKIQRMEQSFEKNIWNPNPSGLCKRYCPVLSCTYNGK